MNDHDHDDRTPILNRPHSPFGQPPRGDDLAPHHQLDVGHRASSRQPEDITFLERLEGTTDEITAGIAELHGYLSGVTRPAERRIVSLTSLKPTAYDQDGRTCPSIGIYNPSRFTVYVALGGEQARPGVGAIEVKPGAFQVLPVAVQDITVGVDPLTMPANVTVYVQVFRFWSLQAAMASVPENAPGSAITVPIIASASGVTQLVAAPNDGRAIMVTSYMLVASAAVGVTFKSAANALTGQMPFGANGGASAPPGSSPWLVCNPNEALNIDLGAAFAVAGHLAYVLA